MTLKPQDPKGLEVFKRLAEQAARRGRKFRPDVKQNSASTMRAAPDQPPHRLGSISASARTAPITSAGLRSESARAWAGLCRSTGAARRGPDAGRIPVADPRRAFCAIGILTALLERDVSGEGQWYRPRCCRAQIFMLDFQASRWLMEKDVAKQAGNKPSDLDPDRRFKTSDGYINIATTGGRIWNAARRRSARPNSSPSRLCHRAGALEEPRRTQRDNRQAHREESTDVWVKELNEAACPAARSIRSTRCSTTPRSSISASPNTCRTTRTATSSSSASR